MLAPLLHIVHPAVHNHQHDAREQLEHLLSWHTLIEHLTEEIYRVGLECWVEIVGEGVQLLFYGVQLVFIIVGARLLLLDGIRGFYEERIGRTLAVSRTGDESHLGKQNGPEALQFLIVYLLQLMKDAVSGLRHFAGIIAALDFEETAEPLSSLRKAIRKFLAQHRLSFFIKRTVLRLRRGFIGYRIALIRSAFRERIPETDDAVDDAFEHHGAVAEAGELFDGQHRTGVLPVIINLIIIYFAARLLHLLIRNIREHPHHELQSSLIALILAVAAYAPGAQVPLLAGDDEGAHVLSFQG